MPRLCRPPAKHSLTQPGKPPARPPMIIDVETGDSGRLSRPKVALPAPDPHKAEVVELDVAVVALPDMPEQHRLAEAVIRRLGKGARAGNRTTAVVEPVADDMPARKVAHLGAQVG